MISGLAKEIEALRTDVFHKRTTFDTSSYELKSMLSRIQSLINLSNLSTEMPDVEGSNVPSIASLYIGKGTELIERLYKIFKNQDNWDGYGTPKISEPLKQKCFEILGLICKSRYDLPFVLPVAGGGLQFEWRVGKKELEIEFTENETNTLQTEKLEKERFRYIEDEKVPIDQIPELILWLENT